MPSICLIVQSETFSPELESCLLSVREHVDYWLISVAETHHSALTKLMYPVAGECFNSSSQVPEKMCKRQQQLRRKIDYFLWLEPDMRLLAGNSYSKADLVDDLYYLPLVGKTVYYLPRLISRQLEFRLSDDYLQAQCLQNSSSCNKLESLQIAVMRSSLPWQTDISAEENNAKSPASVQIRIAERFYLHGQYTEAKNLFSGLAAGEDEASWLAQYRMVQLKQLEGTPTEIIVDAYLQVFNKRPHRAEPLFQIARTYRSSGHYSLALLFAERAILIKYPRTDCLAIERSIYEYALSVECATCFYLLGHHPEAVQAANRALNSNYLPIELRDQVIDNRRLSLDIMFPAVSKPLTTQNKIKIISTFRNAGEFLTGCVASLLSQDYKYFEVIFIDDASNDQAYKAIPEQDKRFKLIRNTKRRGALYSHVLAIQKYCAAGDIIVRLDGDDRLAESDALSFINDYYNQHDCQVMIGQSYGEAGNYGFARPFTSSWDLYQSARCVSFISPVHILTYRAELMLEYRANVDHLNDHFKDDAGKWLMAATDTALCCVLFQLAGFDKTRYNDKILYRYRENNPQSEKPAYRQAQIESCAILARRAYLSPHK